MENSKKEGLENILSQEDMDKLPVNYRLMQATGGEKRYVSFVSSNFYQTDYLQTKVFYKPISKIIASEDEE